MHNGLVVKYLIWIEAETCILSWPSSNAHSLRWRSLNWVPGTYYILQVYSDLQPFTDLYRHPPGTAIDLTSAPVILHLLHDHSLLDYVAAAGNSMENCDFKKVGGFFVEYSHIFSVLMYHIYVNIVYTAFTIHHTLVRIRHFICWQEVLLPQIHQLIMSGNAVEEAKQLCQSHAQAALNVVQETFEPSDACTALENIINALKIY